MAQSTGESRKSSPSTHLAIPLTPLLPLLTLAPSTHLASSSLSLPPILHLSGNPSSPKSLLSPNPSPLIPCPFEVESWWPNPWFYPGYGTMPPLLHPLVCLGSKSDLC